MFHPLVTTFKAYSSCQKFFFFFFQSMLSYCDQYQLIRCASKVQSFFSLRIGLIHWSITQNKPKVSQLNIKIHIKIIKYMLIPLLCLSRREWDFTIPRLKLKPLYINSLNKTGQNCTIFLHQTNILVKFCTFFFFGGAKDKYPWLPFFYLD